MTLNLIFTHPRAFSLCIMQNVNISITTFFFFIMHAFSMRFLKLLFPVAIYCRSIKLTYRILEVLFIRSGCHFYSSKYFPNQWAPRFIKSFQKEKRRKLFANMPISCWSKSVLSMGRCQVFDLQPVHHLGPLPSTGDRQKTVTDHNKRNASEPEMLITRSDLQL